MQLGKIHSGRVRLDEDFGWGYPKGKRAHPTIYVRVPWDSYSSPNRTLGMHDGPRQFSTSQIVAARAWRRFMHPDKEIPKILDTELFSLGLPRVGFNFSEFEQPEETYEYWNGRMSFRSLLKRSVSCKT